MIEESGCRHDPIGRMYSGWMVADAPSPDWRAIAATMRLINSQGVVRVCPLRAEKINGSEIFEIHFACFDRFPNSASDGDAPEPSKEEDSTPRPGTKKRPIQRTPLEGHLSDVFQTSVCLRPMRLRVNNPLSIELSELYYEHFGTCVGRPPMMTGNAAPWPTERDIAPLPEAVAGNDSRAPSATQELDTLVGLDDVKCRLEEIVAYAAKRRGQGRPCLHMAFRGNPGTGKTTVARILARMLGEAGVLEHPENFVECDRSGLVGMYVGHTAQQTLEKIKQAEGGLLFIDEAYSLGMYGNLGSGPDGGIRSDFGDEAISTLVKAMEDRQGDFVCVMAGYTAPMDRMISRNPGLRDRIAFYLDFPDYSPAELREIFRGFCEREGMDVTDDSLDEAERALGAIAASSPQDFSNARMARKVFERCLIRQATMRDDLLITRDVVVSAMADRDLAALVGEEPTPVGFCA